MKFGTFLVNGTEQAAVVMDDTFVPLAAMFPSLQPGLADVAVGDLSKEIALRVGDHPRLPLSSARFLPPLPHPGKIICVGLNYDEHRLEGKHEKAGYPTLFSRFAESLVAHNEAIRQPPESVQLDFEGEIAVVIGRPGFRIRRTEALAHVFGYSCFNDASLRDWQRHTSQWLPGKNFNSTGGFGPFLVTAESVPDPEALSLTTRLNGAIVQQARSDQMIFSVPEIIEYVSTFTTLMPGDVIATGTPAGVGVARKPPLFMKPGDIVEVEISHLGTLRNSVAAAA